MPGIAGEFLDGLTRDQVVRDVTTGGGSYVSGNASVRDGDFVSRDKINIDLLGDNKTKQYEAVIAATRDGVNDPAKLFFVGFDLSGRNLIGFKLVEAQLSNANLSGANLIGANLSGASLRGANLTGANLSSADLSGATLTNANLTDANLGSADLINANLTYANLTRADLRGADLCSADLDSADLDSANLWGAAGDSHTIWPRGFDARESGISYRYSIYGFSWTTGYHM